MKAGEFVSKWEASAGKEAASYVEHFNDLCRLVGEQTPNEADPEGVFYAFQKGATKLDGNGFADVWQKNHFAWEYKTKGKHPTLEAAYKQVQTYREALENPPLLVVSDFERFEVHTNWTNTESWIYRFRNADINSGDRVEITTLSGEPPKDAPKFTALQVLKKMFEDPDQLKPGRTTDQITYEAAQLFEKLAKELRKWDVEDMRVARFVTRMIFCMFATDVGLLPRESFSDIIDVHKKSGDNEGFRKHLSDLFAVMQDGGEFNMRHIPHFNGRLFEDTDVPDKISTQEILWLNELDRMNWSDVEPSIFGTLFVRILDPDDRRKLGAVYTSRTDIELIVKPVLMAPLEREWEEVRSQAQALFLKTPKKAAKILDEFHERLGQIRILDPACGSGNFLYVSLALLKALEKEVMAFSGLHGISLSPVVHPRQLYGIETNPYAHELAAIVIWIGYLQWKRQNAMQLDDEEPILEPLDQIEHKDSVLDLDGKKPKEPEWPELDIIVGNPPFVGGKKLRTALGDEYVDKLFSVWDGRVPREADFCCYWFEKARAAIEGGTAKRVGLLATQAIRGGKNRRVLEHIKETGDIFYAQSDRKWIQDGIAVRVSMVGFDDGSETRRFLNEIPDDDPEHGLQRARPVEGINANLTGRTDLTKARRLKENLGISFMGDTKVGPFEVSEAVAKKFLASPNPNGKPNTDVVRPWVNGLDITRRPRNMWIIDFPPGMPEQEAAQYETPYEYAKEHVKPFRAKARTGDITRSPWWIHHRPRPAMRVALSSLSRFIATTMVAKHRMFSWLPGGTLVENVVIAFARSSDYFFGVLQSRVHDHWARGMGTQLREVSSGFRYTPTTTFETFPFPQASDDLEGTIADAAKELDKLRGTWLNPKEDIGEKALKKRTLTNLYNERPTWLANAHKALDEAVFAAYGWDDSPDDAEILARLLALNLEREAVGE
ncbi:MAG: class I SAM-dependent DNA methyltransferase [Chloroflexi bacterium]|nr:class I SAM-dependent DNA methyltransferase [Chloroflexota bacterium]